MRPLVAAGDEHGTKELIRDHEVEVDERSGLISILGGKWTTHRLMAEDTTYDVRVYRTEVYKGSRVTTYRVRWKTAHRRDAESAEEEKYK